MLPRIARGRAHHLSYRPYPRLVLLCFSQHQANPAPRHLRTRFTRCSLPPERRPLLPPGDPSAPGGRRPPPRPGGAARPGLSCWPARNSHMSIDIDNCLSEPKHGGQPEGRRRAALAPPSPALHSSWYAETGGRPVASSEAAAGPVTDGGAVHTAVHPSGLRARPRARHPGRHRHLAGVGRGRQHVHQLQRRADRLHQVRHVPAAVGRRRDLVRGDVRLPPPAPGGPPGRRRVRVPVTGRLPGRGLDGRDRDRRRVHLRARGERPLRRHVHAVHADRPRLGVQQRLDRQRRQQRQQQLSIACASASA